ncbi:MAG: hypothetical protein J6K24_07075 [Tidjanibacter sp.]|nr:hypothetical protein [Tidjanibacter sp.]
MKNTTYLNVRYTDYNPELVYLVEILTVSDSQQNLYRTYVNPEEEIFDYGLIYEFGATANQLESAPSFPAVYEQICSLLQGQTVLYHMPSNKLALQAVCNRYGLLLPDANYINSERIVRRVWTEHSQSGYGLGSMRAALDIPADLTSAEATYEIIQRAIEHTGSSLEELIELANRPRVRLRENSHIESMEGNPEGPLYGETIVFTGSLDRPRKDLRDVVVALGCNFADSLTRETTMLVVGNYNNPTVLTTGKSGKLAKAEKLNKDGKAHIEIMSSDSFYMLIAELTDAFEAD